jgi:hypothetical protein
MNKSNHTANELILHSKDWSLTIGLFDRQDVSPHVCREEGEEREGKTQHSFAEKDGREDNLKWR